MIASIDCLYINIDKHYRGRHKKTAGIACGLCLILFLFLGDGAEDIIPKGRAYTKVSIGVLVVVHAMVYPEPFEDILRRLVSVYDVVYPQVGNIAKDETREEAKGHISHDEAEQVEEGYAEQCTCQWRHGQAVFVLGIIVVNPMNEVLELGALLIGGGDMKQIAVDQVFDQGKGECTQNEVQRRQHSRNDAVVQAIGKYGDGGNTENTDRHEDVRAGKLFQKWVVKETTCSFVAWFRCFY